MSYNGWTNYETWAWKLWMDEDAAECEYWRETADDILENSEPSEHFTAEQEALYTLQNMLKEKCELDAEEWMPEQAGPFADLLNSAIREINWREIAEAILNP